MAAVSEQHSRMATESGVKTVWIGFMDIVPVIGTVKEPVELVLALYEGNKEVIKEKEKAVENIVRESLKKHVKPTLRMYSSDQPAAAATAAKSEFSGLKNVTEVREEKIIECMMKGSKRGTKPTPTQRKEREQRLKAINADMLEKIRIIKPNFGEVLKEELKRSRRGEHVFNNDILRFHFKVLTEFIQSRHIYNLRGYNQQTMNDLGRHTIDQNTEIDIQNNMVVHFEDDEFYVNANAVMYGEYSRALRNALLQVLNHINRGEVTEQERERVNFVVDNMNNLQIYVDELAKAKWIANRRDRLDRFEEVRHEVATMYSIHRGFDWCIDILNVVAPLFGLHE